MITMLPNAKFEHSCLGALILKYIEPENLGETCTYVQLQTTSFCSIKTSLSTVAGADNASCSTLQAEHSVA